MKSREFSSVQYQLKEVRTEVSHVLDQHCKSCKTYKHLKQSKEIKATTNYCLSECLIGKKLQKYGQKLDHLSKIKRMKRAKVVSC